MLWTIFRFMLLLLPLAWLASLPAPIEIAFGSWRISSRIGAVLFLLLAFVVFLWIAMMALRAVLSSPHNLRLWRNARRQQAGYQALLSSLGEGDNPRALRDALSARKLLGNNPLSTLIAAQIAEATSENQQATDLYATLRDVNETRFVALLSLARLSRTSGDLATAQSYLEQAQSLHPKSQQLHHEQIAVAQQDGSPQVALAILDKMRRRDKKLSASLSRLESTLRIDAMRSALEKDDWLEALRQAEGAYKASPSHAIVAYAQRLADGSNVNKALGRKIIVARWSEFAGRALAETFFRLNDATKPIDRVRLFENLIGGKGKGESKGEGKGKDKSSLKSRLLLCELLLDARLWARAEDILDEESAILERSDAPRSELLSYLGIRARLAKEAHNDLDAQQHWLDRLSERAKQEV